MGVLDRLGVRKAAGTSVVPAAPSAAELEAATMALRLQTGAGAFGSPGMPLRPRTGVGGEPRIVPRQPGANIVANVTRDGRHSFDTLKWLAENYDIAAMCIEHRINDIRSLPWAIVPADGVEENVDEAVKIATRRMRKPDGQHRLRQWLHMFLSDVLKYDAGCLYKRRDRIGRTIALEVVSGRTIQPIGDYWGRQPSGEAAAYVQFYQGQAEKWFTADQLIYEPLNPTSESLFGTAPLEGILVNANTDMRFQQHFLNYFTAGTVPEGFLILPDEYSTPPLLKDFQESFDGYMEGDARRKRQMRMLPHETEVVQTKDTLFDAEFPLFLMRKTCAIFHVTPQDLGFTEDVNRATGETQADVQFRTGTQPLVEYLQDIFNDFLQYDLGLPVQFQFDTGKESEDRVNTAKADDLMIRAGVLSPDWVAEERYGIKVDKENPTPRIFVAGTLVSRLDTLAAGAPVDPETGVSDEPQTPGAVATGEAPTSPDEAHQQAPATVPPAGPASPPGPTVEKRASSPSADRAGLVLELTQWRSNTMKRLERGQPVRKYRGAVHMDTGLVDLVYGMVAKAQDRDDADAMFAAAIGAASGDAGPKARTPSWRDTPPVETPQHQFDLRFTDHYQPEVGAGLRALTSPDVVRDAIAAAGDPVNTVDAVLRAGADPTKLSDVLGVLWGQGYTGGQYAALEQLGKPVPALVADVDPGGFPEPLATDLTWNQALVRSHIELRGITQNHLDRIGELIVDGAESGQSVEELARDIGAYIEDPSRAELIAHTELARMVSLGSEREYRAAGVQQWDWVVSAGACRTCLEQAENNPHRMGDSIPPAHPRCRCSMAPRSVSYITPPTADGVTFDSDALPE